MMGSGLWRLDMKRRNGNVHFLRVGPVTSSLAVVDLDDAYSAGKRLGHTVEPNDTGHVHLLVYRDASSKIDKLVHVKGVVRRPDHLLLFLGIGSGSAHGEGDFGAGVGEVDGFGFRGSDDAEDLWRVCDLDPEGLVFGGGVGLDQELHGIDLCNMGRSIYARQRRRENERTFARGIPSLVPVHGGDRDGEDVWKEGRAANVG